MAQALDEIIKELDAGYNPSRDLINQKLSALPGQADAEISGLNAQKDQAFNDILAGARDRGLGFGGMPIADQAKYASTNFLPAVAKVRQSQNDSQSSLLDSLSNVNLDQRKTALGLRQQQLDRDEQQRQFNEQLAAQERDRQRQAAAQQSALNSLYGGGGGGASPVAAAAQKAAPQGAYGFKNGKDGKGGFWFKDANGQQVNALQYAARTGLDIQDLLRRMGAAGDYNASQALAFWKRNPKASAQYVLHGYGIA